MPARHSGRGRRRRGLYAVVRSSGLAVLDVQGMDGQGATAMGGTETSGPAGATQGMAAPGEPRTFGIEEELLLVSPATWEAVPKAGEVLAGYAATAKSASGPVLTAEFQQEMIEVVIPPHSTMAGLEADIVAGRAMADAAARAVGARAAALATSPLPVDPHPVRLRRFAAMTEEYGITAREQLTCGCHIHVAVNSQEEGVGVLDRIRIWLPVLSALGTNSPFWHGKDTGYASYRSQVWSRWPSAGPQEVLGSPEAYHQLVHDMVTTGVLLDEGMVYFDARLSRHYPTVEIRISDVCLRPENTVLLAGIARALVETSARQWQDGVPPADVPASMLRLAGWKAGRWGLRGDLLDPLTHRPAPAVTVVNGLVHHIRDALEASGDLHRVESLIDDLLHSGTGATRQLEVMHRTGNLEAVVADAAACTVWSPAAAGEAS